MYGLAVLVLIGVAGVLAALRIARFKSQAFQAAAHLYVGFLLGAVADSAVKGGTDWGCLALAVALSVVELACFLLL